MRVCLCGVWGRQLSSWVAWVEPKALLCASKRLVVGLVGGCPQTRHTPTTAIQFLRQRLAVADTHRAAGCTRVDCMAPEHGWDLEAVCKGFIDHAVEEMGVKDNVTALLIQHSQ
jgi:hypothetical protein